MLHILPDGDRRYRLVDGDGREIGWIRGRAVRFLGFLSEEDMVNAASKAWRALRSVLAQSFGHTSAGKQSDKLRHVYDGAYEWIADGVIPIARVFRSRNAADPSLAIELVLPSYVDEALTKEAALSIARALGQAPVTTGA